VPFALSTEQVLALAPDTSSVAAAKKLAKPGAWRNLGQSESALWGECQGSALYQTQVALSDLATKCSCPSRKFPCKHALGLLLVAVSSPAAVPAAAAPEWVGSWLGKRAKTEEARQAKQEVAVQKPVDQKAQARRARRRSEGVEAGIAQLEAWMEDLMRQGLARAESEPPSFWDQQARRLVDAQAPGLAARVRKIGGMVGTSRNWSERALDELGMLALITHAWRRFEALDARLQHDVRRSIGYTLDQQSVVAHGDVVEDDWWVTGETTSEEEQVRMQRAWLVGEASGRTALLLQFAAGAARFAEALVVGTRFRGRLAFWPSAHPQRALVAERMGPAVSHCVPPRGATIAAALDRFATALGNVPWLERELIVLASAIVVPGEPWQLVDDSGSLPLVKGAHDVLLAVGGGQPAPLAAEWDGYELHPVATWIEGRVVPLAGGAHG